MFLMTLSTTQKPCHVHIRSACLPTHNHNHTRSSSPRRSSNHHHFTTAPNFPHTSKMSAALKATTVIGGLAVFATAATYSTRQTSDFSKQALAAAEHGASEVSATIKPKL